MCHISPRVRTKRKKKKKQPTVSISVTIPLRRGRNLAAAQDHAPQRASPRGHDEFYIMSLPFLGHPYPSSRPRFLTVVGAGLLVLLSSCPGVRVGNAYKEFDRLPVWCAVLCRGAGGRLGWWAVCQRVATVPARRRGRGSGGGRRPMAATPEVPKKTLAASLLSSPAFLVFLLFS